MKDTVGGIFYEYGNWHTQGPSVQRHTCLSTKSRWKFDVWHYCFQNFPQHSAYLGMLKGFFEAPLALLIANLTGDLQYLSGHCWSTEDQVIMDTGG